MKIDVAIIGAGVIGLALARECARRNPHARIVVLEQAANVGRGVSSRSSEVIHAGLYYPASHLKSSLCVRGREPLYQYCREHGVPHRKIGKLVVANTDEEHEFLHALAFRAAHNGVTDLQWLDRRQLSEIEPAVHAKGAFLSPSTGIVDTATLMRCLEKDVLDLGVTLSLHTVVGKITCLSNGFDLHCMQGAEHFALRTKSVVNGAGLQATQLAKNTEGFPAKQIPDVILAKGDYFSYHGKNPFTHLVYPVPVSGSAVHSLGIHATLDMQQQLRFGPDIEVVAQEDYRVDESKRSVFATAIRRYFPALDGNKLQPAYAGIRPRLATGTHKTPDFLVQDKQQHGIPGLVNLFGIESPGLTCCLAMAEHVAALESLHLC